MQSDRKAVALTKGKTVQNPSASKKSTAKKTAKKKTSAKKTAVKKTAKEGVKKNLPKPDQPPAKWVTARSRSNNASEVLSVPHQPLRLGFSVGR